MPAPARPAAADAPRPAPRGGPDPLLALADRCVQCGLCLPHCPTYQFDRSEAESPRGRIAQARALASGRLAPSAAGDTHMDHCLGCLRCETACPAGVAYGDLLGLARAAQAARRPPPWRTRLALALLARPRWWRWLQWPARWLGRLPAPPPRPAPAPAPAVADGPAVAVFVGCIADPYEAGSREALARLLAATGQAVHVPAGQGCCGAAAVHAGDRAGAARLAAANRAAFAGAERVACLASGCQRQLAASLDGEARVADALVWLADRAERLAFRPAGHRVALHWPCTQSALPGSAAALRRLLARVPGLDLVELPDRGCCGGAGLHQLEEPARAAALRAPLLEALAASGARELLSANIGCRLHLGQAARMIVRHPVDFLAEHLA